MEQIDQIQQYLEKGNLKKALESLAELTKENQDWKEQVALQSGRYHELLRKEQMGVISYENASLGKNQVAFALIQLVAAIEAQLEKKLHRVFISYNHQDAVIAGKLRQRLQAAEIQVTMDSASMQAGQSIADFISTAIRDTETTLSIVSVKSLLSAWVAMETLQTFGLEKGPQSKKFIPCYTSPDFFDPGFTDNALEQIGDKIAVLAPLLEQRIKSGQDTLDIQDEYSRLIKLKNNLGEIIGKLRGSLCMDISDTGFEASFPRILEAIRQ
ncbi:TIR domain-containing protein [Niabella terrae]